MQARLRQWFTPSTFPDDELKTHQVAILDFALLFALVMDGMLIATSFADRQINPSLVAIDIGALFALVGVRLYVRRGHVKWISEGVIGFGIAMLTYVMAMKGTIDIPATAGYLVLIVAAGLLLRGRGLAMTTALCSLAVGGIIWAKQAEMPQLADHAGAVTQWLWLTIWFSSAASLSYLGLRSIRTSLAQSEREIAARRLAEAQLNEAQQLAHVGNWEWDLLTRHVYWSAEVYRLFGVNPDTFTPSIEATAQFVLPEDREKFRLAQPQLRPESPTTTIDHRITRCDGEIRHVQNRARGVFDAAGQLLRVIGTVQDITDLKQVEEALRESQSLYHSLVEVSPLSICRKDRAGRFTFANQRFLEETHIALNDLLGQTDFALHPSQLAEKYRRDDQIVMESRRVWELIEERQIVGGETIIVQSIKTPVYDGAGNVNGVQISFWDITARQRAEDAVRDLNATLEQRVADRTAELQAANQQLTELDRLKDEFMSRISHELRTPLTSIKIYLELLENAKPEKHAHYLQTVRQEADRLHLLIEDVLDFSQLNLNLKPAALAPIDVNYWLESRLTTWQRLSAGHGLEFKLHLAHGLPLASGHDELFVHALTRLVSNAVNYTPHGEVTVSTSLQVDNDRRWVTVSVADTGLGIPVDDLPHIFERFFRGHAAADYKVPGTGMGLSICREIAERLGGHLTVETQVGAGSTFTLWLRASV
ncbi:MAG: PAS domain S-box protein [Anaerolineae bacterium]